MILSVLLTGLILSSITAALLMLVKKLFRKQLTAAWHYRLWFLLMIALAIPWVPADVWVAATHPLAPPSSALYDAAASTISGSGDAGAGTAGWLQDFTESVHRSTPDAMDTLASSVWLAGTSVLGLLTLQAWLKIRSMTRTFRSVEHPEVRSLFEQCKQRLKISGTVTAVESPLVKSPMLLGIWRTYVVLPEGFSETYSMEECRYVFLHELSHYKSKDHLTNGLVILFQLLYWYQPLVWIAFRRMRLDRELACDTAVLQLLDEPDYAEYGRALIHLASGLSRPVAYAGASPFTSSKGQIRRRIQWIAAYKAESGRLRRSSLLLFSLVGVLVAGQTQVAAVLGREDDRTYYFASERTVNEDWSAYFGGYEGSFVLYDTQADKYLIHNREQSTWRISPDSTYKIYSALFGLDSGVITGEHSDIPWNGEPSPYEAWNQDQNVYTAIKGSVSWYFRELDRQVGEDRLRAYLKRIGYGNTDLSGGLGRHWLESSLKISPVEQVQLLKALYTNGFGFQPDHIGTVKEAMKLAERDGARLYGKTGTGAVNGREISGWFVGCVESRGNAYFFAAHIQNKDHANGSTAAEMTLSILKDQGIFPAPEASD
ncbi:regulatory protein BlaR1 [Paenibacillus mucilaginosus 3016]|uniref:Regulatory protein BlaR1 n=1 Tax=Paenibacillus mucilaginosus 3016 TaxID=1116391 RepID=H6NFE1_9BACL|nr:BlaR1 family beta-lactam sensor/signal transducer [Paenibacillus mucilaginosus]AFC29550.1 regulatory protein BlaR1 [Paenibacillus mucilaginosus 3016]WFA18242.1 BlaR1 family beta-lactam sensor/signal transducer [Paenibacillus mucilaginosus]